jgi:hypothetical protein
MKMLKRLIRNTLLLCALFASSQVFAQNCAGVGCGGGGTPQVLDRIIVTGDRYNPNSGGFFFASIPFFGVTASSYGGLAQVDVADYLLTHKKEQLEGLVEKYKLPCKKVGEGDTTYAGRATKDCTVESTNLAISESPILSVRRGYVTAVISTYCAPHVSDQITANKYSTCPST